MSDLIYGIRQPWEVDKYYNDPATLGSILKAIVASGREYYVDMKGEPTVKVGGQWMGYEDAMNKEKEDAVSTGNV